VLCLVGKAAAVETYNKVINSVTESFELPCVIALKRIVKFRLPTTLACNRVNVIWRDQNQCQYCAKYFPD
jgi:5-methylcytosine-specific restriction endonuclease McrA